MLFTFCCLDNVLPISFSENLRSATVPSKEHANKLWPIEDQDRSSTGPENKFSITTTGLRNPVSHTETLLSLEPRAQTHI